MAWDSVVRFEPIERVSEFDRKLLADCRRNEKIGRRLDCDFCIARLTGLFDAEGNMECSGLDAHIGCVDVLMAHDVGKATDRGPNVRLGCNVLVQRFSVLRIGRCGWVAELSLMVPDRVGK